ncbi:M23 family metallopeptidase [Pseudorhodoferax sp.]|uniref:M23 family metallopeptidase n=1 Tax=Pseudorhodoferax sp. TaxID=1993553 RepID=UPI002DD69E76|nr:M23 family metallopeptidase [Pseudorhodoferax sp.]
MTAFGAPLRLQAQQFVARHRRGIVATVVAGLGGFAVTAFGIAPLMPDPAALPVRQLTEAVQPEGLNAQFDALNTQRLDLRRNTISRGTDSVESLLARLGISDATAAAFIRRDELARRVVQGRGGKVVQASTDENGMLTQLVARYPAEQSAQRLTHFTRLTIEKVDGQWGSKVETAELVSGVRLGSGTIRSSLFAATDEAGLPDVVAMQMAEMFSADIDFHRELRRGDNFSVVYESLSADGETVPWNEGVGRVLAAEFVNGSKTHQALWFVDGQGRGAYFGPDGASRKRVFLASPLEFSRVTSGFAMRFHPLLKTWRAHLGTDYGAPTGTPVRVVGDGTVKFAGRQNGYGNVIEVQHSNNRSTLYAHLSRIDVRRGQRVDQGEHIGAVGATGWATGPHLHFEFRVNGQHQDPLKVVKASEALRLDASDLGRFGVEADASRSRLQLAGSLAGASRATFE